MMRRIIFLSFRIHIVIRDVPILLANVSEKYIGKSK